MKYLLLLISLPCFAQDLLCWKAPDKRENGEELRAEEIGGYTIKTSDGFIQLGPNRLSYKITTEPPPFTIAVYDTNNLYSEFISISPKKSCLPAPGDLKLDAPQDLKLGD